MYLNNKSIDNHARQHFLYVPINCLHATFFVICNFFFQNWLFQKIQEYHQSVSQFVIVGPGPGVIKLFSCSTQLSTKFQLLIKTKILTKKFLALSLSGVVFIKLINVKMPTVVGILTFMSRINFVLR